MADSPSSQRSRHSFTPDQYSISPAPSIRSSRSQRLVSNSLQRPLSTTSSEAYFNGDDLLQPPRLQHAESRFSLNEQFATSRREYDFEGDDYSFSESASLLHAEEAADVEDDGEVLTSESHGDYYNLLGLSREINPTTAQLATAYEWHKTSLALNQNQRSAQLTATIQEHSARLRFAYETLIHPQRRVVYDLLGEDGLRQEYSVGGIMGKGGEAERSFADVEVMSAEEFKGWFKQILEEKDLEMQELRRSRGTWVLEPYSGLKLGDIFGLTSLKDLNSALPTSYSLHLAVHQKFGISLKRLRQLFSSDQVEIESEIEAVSKSDNSSTSSCRHASHEGPILTISGGIISSICSKTQQGRSVFDRSSISQFLPSCAAQLHQTFTGFTAGNDNSLDSLMRGTSVDLYTDLWPRRRYSVGIGRHLTVLDRTRPFYCYLQTTFQSNSTTAIAMRVERPVDDNALLYYQFKSADSYNTWLGFNPACGLEFGLPFFSKEPTADIGYYWSRSRMNLKRYQGPEQYTGPNMIMHHEDSFGSEGQGGKLGCTVTTASACVSAKYVFDMFGEKCTLPEETRSTTKIEMAAYLQDNLTFTWLVRALRNIGGSTQFGVGIAVKPGTGLFLTCSWSRWGQDLNIPIFIVPYGLLDNKWCLMAFAVPCALGMLVEFAPGRRRKRLADAKKKR